MSTMDAATLRGGELHSELDRAAVIAAVRRDIADMPDSGFPEEPTRQQAYMLGWLGQQVAGFLNKHPEHRAELLPGLEADTTGGGW